MVKEGPLIPAERIEKLIFMLRGHKVILDKDLAMLYSVTTKALNQAVKRNIERFPSDFMFQLTKEETIELLRSQFVTLEKGYHYRYLPYVFTENGVAMLSSVLKSERAIKVNIEMMRTFTKLREILTTHKELRTRIEEIERKYDVKFKAVFDAIRQMMTPPEKPKRKIGY